MSPALVLDGACQRHGQNACRACHGLHHDEWGVLDERLRSRLNSARVPQRYRAGDVVFSEGEPCQGVHCVDRGLLALRKRDPSGRAVIVRLVPPGRTIGQRSFFGGEPRMATAIALVDSELCHVDASTVSSLLDESPALARRFLAQGARELREAEDAIVRTAHLPVRSRLAALLVELKDVLGSADEEGCISLHLPLTREQLAELLGARRETVARAMRALSDDDVASFQGRAVTIGDLDVLLDEVESSSDRESTRSAAWS